MALVVKDQYANKGYGTTFGGPTLGALLVDGADMVPLTYGGVIIIAASGELP